MYGSKFTGQFGVKPDVNGDWFAVLRNLTPQQLRHGLAAIAQQMPEWCPAAIDFKRYCYPTAEQSGLPNADQAYLQICQLTNVASSDQIKWQDSHPAIYHAWLNMDKFAFKEATGRLHKQLFVDAYKNTLSMVFQGAELPPVPIAIEHKEPPKEKPEPTTIRSKKLANIRKENCL